MDNGLAIQADDALDDHHETPADIKNPVPTTRPNGHRKSISNTILSRLNFLRTSSEEARSPFPQVDGETDDAEDDGALPTEGAMAMAQKTAKTRKRKGSLRKTALLGTGKFNIQGRERRNSLLQRRPSVKQHDAAVISPEDDQVEPNEAVQELQRTLNLESPVMETTSDNTWPSFEQRPPSIPPIDTTIPPISNGNGPTLASPIKSPTSQSYASTTDDEESLTFSRPANGVLHQQVLKGTPSLSSIGSSYFPSQQPIVRSRSLTKPLSPLSALPMDAYGPEEEHDYSETEWWGWVLLTVTWIVFVVGMGSCLEVWSWAWDVGQTPYAPPELEDDVTLPIVGYYPALIILTAVMAWVWVVVAWVGMKYFKHATIQGEDT